MRLLKNLRWLVCLLRGHDWRVEFKEIPMSDLIKDLYGPARMQSQRVYCAFCEDDA